MKPQQDVAQTCCSVLPDLGPFPFLYFRCALVMTVNVRHMILSTRERSTLSLSPVICHRKVTPSRVVEAFLLEVTNPNSIC
ncbi:Uncharacterized protein APZ42_013111 [Daphnia magna]|uniref:Uncharacterized protein n=1 Tax=Daphnia magna TaxID=35525 RepID=A0A162R603_9CRUS|nr:Uncharacterized protein APZ42_013111 [Daphnia magna]